MDGHDFLIIGGGSAGCALANRLSADPSTRVLVLEAGRPDYRWDVFIHMPAALTYPIGSRFYDWKYESEPEPHMGGRRVYHARGKVLGGSSSINGMIFQRGNPMDYEKWAAEPGMERWDYAHCLPYFKRLETTLAGADEYRGGTGPLVLERGPAENPLFGAFFAAGEQAGIPTTTDVNGYRQEGFAAFDANRHRGRRLSASRAYLHPVMDRPNLSLVTRAHITRILFEGNRAVGVEYRKGRRLRRAEATELILCGGAINSPQTLMLSGIGPAGHLESFGIEVVADLPGVGQNLQDHLEVYIQHASKPTGVPPALSGQVADALDRAAVAVPHRPGDQQPLRGRRLRAQQRPGGISQPDASLPARGDPLRRVGSRPGTRLPGARRPDVLRRAGRHHAPFGRSVRQAGAALQLPLHAQRPPRVGGGGPLRPPESSDNRPSSPSTPGNSRRDLRCRPRRRSSTGCGGTPRPLCIPPARPRWGPTRWRWCRPTHSGFTAIDGLRVVDASVMPTITNGNIYAPVMMIAEKAADAILGNTPLPPEEVAWYRHGVVHTPAVANWASNRELFVMSEHCGADRHSPIVSPVIN